MFETRLRLILIFFATCWAIVVVRLFQLQVVQADDYREQAECLLTRSSKYLEAIRGRILDRNGLVLASNEPAWAIAMHYRLLVRDPDYLKALAAKSLRLRGKKRPSEAEIGQSRLRLQ